MAEVIGQPTQFDIVEDHKPGRLSKYPWTSWFAKPYMEHVLLPEVDFPSGARKGMVTQAYNAARKMGLMVRVSANDPLKANRLALCAYDDPTRVPRLTFGGGGIVAFEQDYPSSNIVTCGVCGDTQDRVEWLMDIRECIQRNPFDELDTSMYYRHRPVDDTQVGLEKVEIEL